MLRALVTGASGWVGGALCQRLQAAGHQVSAVNRRPGTLAAGVSLLPPAGDDFTDLERSWTAQSRFDVVFHLAARVHVMQDVKEGAAALYDASNRAASLRVAELARRRGTRRLVFLSSIKALGESDRGAPLAEDATPLPEDDYGVSKRRAEQALASLADIEHVIVRAPLVYGPGVRANFLKLLDLVARGWPLPLGAARARRSLVALDNLCDALIHCAIDERAANQVFHVADPEAPSVRELIEAIGVALQRPAHLFPVPVALLQHGARLVGRGAEIARLTTSLRVDTTHITQRLEWRAPLSMHEALAGTARWYQTRMAS